MSVIDFIKFWFLAGNAHGLHSPFAFDLYIRVISTHSKYYDFDTIEECRLKMLESAQSIKVSDFGAGSRKGNSKEKRIGDIARVSLKSPKVGELLFKLVNEFQPKTIFDLGTSLGITTMYLAAPNKKNSVFTFEGCENIAGIAKENFKKRNFVNITQVVGNLDETLKKTVDNATPLDFVFFDANHRFEPTMRYFEICLKNANQNSVFVFDDIYWSGEMKAAWQKIKENPAVRTTIDLFEVGLVFFRKEALEKQHFKLRF